MDGSIRNFDTLSEDEFASLVRLTACGCDRAIPVEHGDKLLALGLAELTCGGLGPSCAGKRMAKRAKI